MQGESEPTTAREKRGRLWQAIVADVVPRSAPVVLAHGGGQTRAAPSRQSFKARSIANEG
jgi:hypothetical protein